MASRLTPDGWVVEPDVVDERKDLPRLTGAQINAINARIAAGSNEFPTGTKVVRTDDNLVMTVEGVGTAARFTSPEIELADAAKKSELAAPTGAGEVGFVQAGPSAVPWSLEDKVRQTVSFFDTFSEAERLDALSGSPVLDHTVSMQKAIDENKGKRIIAPAGAVFHAAGLTMVGSTYDGTQLDFQGELLLKARPTGSSSTYQGAWVGLLLKDCSGNEVSFRGNGNRANQPDEEHVYLMGLAGVKRLSMPVCIGREIRGDGLYVSQSDWTTTSSNTDGLTIGTFSMTNSAPDGRNGLSLVSADNVNIAAFSSVNVGALVGGVLVQPGGFDIEPNHSGQSCKNITIGTLNVVTAGTTGLAIHGRLGADVTRNVKIGSASVVNTCAPSLNDQFGTLTQTQNFTLKVVSCADVSIGAFQGQFTNAYGDGMSLGDAARLDIRGAVRHVREAVRVGNDTLDDSGGGAGVIDSYIDVSVSDVGRFGHRTGKILRTRITGKISDPTAGFYSSLFGVISFTHTQKDCEYSTSVADSATWTRSYRNDPTTPATFDNTVIRDCDLSGSTWAAFTNQVGDMQVRRINVRGVTDRPSIPSVGTNLWVSGQEFVNSAATSTGTATGWRFNGTAMVPAGYVSTATALPTYAATGAPLRTFDASTVTLPQLGQVVAALVTDLKARGLVV